MIGGVYSFTIAQTSAAQSAETLKSKAMDVVRAGKFDEAREFFLQAQSADAADSQLGKLVKWTDEFNAQRQSFLVSRKKEYDKTVGEVNKLLAADKTGFAIAKLADASTLAVDKEQFRKEPWVVGLIEKAKTLGDEYMKTDEQVRALRLYAQLAAIEPDVALWRTNLKNTTRKVHLLALFLPTELKKIQAQDTLDRNEVEKILNPDYVAPAKEDGPEIETTPWQDTLKGARVDLVLESLILSKEQYWRAITYSQLMEGGVSAIKLAVETPSLSKVFPGLANPTMKASMIGALDAALDKIHAAKTNAEQQALVELLPRLRRINQETVNLPEEVFASEFADGAFADMDPFSVIMWPTEWEDFLKDTKGNFNGVGIQIQLDQASGNLKVVSPLEDTPAYRAGFKPDWIITHIDGRSVKGINVNEAVKRITGPRGTTVKLTVQKTDGKVQEYPLVRELIKVDSVKGWAHKPAGGWDYLIDPENRIGFVRLSRFNENTLDDLRTALKDMTDAGARGCIIDLRYNPGGLLDSAQKVVDQFITSGVIVSSRADRADSPQKPQVFSASKSGSEYTNPIIVLVNQNSASAAEIVSGALKDHHRALIVGERSYGKGSVQMPFMLANQTCALKLTIAHYYLPAGKCIHREETSTEWGVEPDVVIEMTPDQARAALSARQDADILRDEKAPTTSPTTIPTTIPTAKDILSVDPQLNGAVYLMRLQLNQK